MFDHIGLKVKDLDASVGFYKAALAPLGYVLVSQDASSAGLGPSGAAALWLYAAGKRSGTGMHVALTAPDRAAVDRFHAAALGAGARDNGTPGVREEYASNYYAAFVLDPDGNNVEAVFLR